MLPKTSFIDAIDSLDRLQAIRKYLLEGTLDQMPVDSRDKQLVQFHWLLGLCSDCLDEELNSLRILVQHLSSQSRACSEAERRSEPLTEED
jgi:hypothetical protein